MFYHHNFSFRLLCCLLVFLTLSCAKTPPAARSFNLLEAVSEADLIWDTGYISAKTPDFRSALLHGFRIGGTKQEKTIIARGPRSILVFRCFTLEDKTIRFQLKPAGAVQRMLTVQINNQPVAKQKILAGAHSYTVTAPANILRQGINYLAFLSPTDLEFDFVAIENKNGSGNPEYIQQSAQPVTANTTTITAAAPSSARFYLRVPPNASLFVTYGIATKESPAGASARFVIAAEPDGGKRSEISSEVLTNRWFRSSKSTRTISLEAFGNRPVRLSFEAQQRTDQPRPRIYWSAIRISLPEAIPEQKAVGADYLKAGYKSSVYPNVIIYLVDAMRADHLQPYGYSLPITPSLKTFAKDAVVFEDTYSQVSWTRPSITTIMTGLYPSTHLVQDRLDMLPDFLPTLPQQLKLHGYQNIAFITQPNISKQFGFSRDFVHYEELFKRNKDGKEQFPTQSDLLVEKAIEYLKDASLKQTFVYIHAVDTHGPLAPQRRFLPAQSQCDFTNPEINYAQKFQRADQNDPCRVAIYDAAVQQSDFYFGQFLDFLKQKNAYDNSLIIFTADHGESLLEHGKWGHGENLYQADIRVPLIVKFPDQKQAGKRVAGVARHIDVMPTVLEYLGLKKPDGIQGDSLLSLIDHDENRVVFSELSVDKFKKRCIVLDHCKLIETPHPVFGALYELYDTKADPLETLDLKAKRPVLFGYLKAMLHQWERLQAAKAVKLRKPGIAVLDKETEESLKALGYLQ